MGRQCLLHASHFFVGSRFLRSCCLPAGIQSRTRLVGFVNFVGDNVLFSSRWCFGYSDRKVHRQTRCANHDHRRCNRCRRRVIFDALCRATLATFCCLLFLRTRLVGIWHGASHDSSDAMVSSATGECTGCCIDRSLDGRHCCYTIY